MYGEIKVGGINVPMIANAATPLRYKQLFGKDLLTEFRGVEENEAKAVESIPELAFIMAMTATKKLEDMYTLTELDFIRWLSDFEWDDIASEPFLNAVTELWARDNAQDSQPKN